MEWSRVLPLTPVCWVYRWWRVVACGVVDRRCRLGQSRAILLASLSSGCSLPGICFRHHFQSLVDKLLGGLSSCVLL
ncbi:hypothetical protein Bca101_091365 [Brassica carinata]